MEKIMLPPIFLILLLLCSRVAAGAAAEGEPAAWDVSAPPFSASPVEARIATNRGTWMSLDVSPDGKRIVFDLLGDLYELSMAGGEAVPLTNGLAWDMQPRFSPDGTEIAFTSDRDDLDRLTFTLKLGDMFARQAHNRRVKAAAQAFVSRCND